MLSRIGEAQIETHAADVDDNEVWGKIFLAKESAIRFGGEHLAWNACERPG